MFKFNLKKLKIKNNLFPSFQEKAQETSVTNSKSKSDLNTKSSKIKAININLRSKIIDEVNSNIIFNENNLFKFNSDNSRNKKLAIMKKGKIYWLRKLYIIIENTPIKMNKKLYFYFYYPIKDINMEKNKFILFQSYQNDSKACILCDNLNDIHKTIKAFLKNNGILNLIKINLYTENFNLIKMDNQLMTKIEKYKILYAKIILLSKEQIDKKIIRVFSHKNFSNKFIKNENNLLNNKLIKNKFSLNTAQPNKRKKINNVTKVKSYNNVANSLDELILDDINNISNIEKNFIHTRNFFNNKKDKTYLTVRNNTANIFQNLKIRKNQIPIMKSKKLLNYNFNSFSNIFNKFNPNKNHELKQKLFLKSAYNNFRNYKNNRNNNIINNVLIQISPEKENNNIKLLNERKNNNSQIYNIYKENLKYDNKLSWYNDKAETNQILFIALNSLIKNFAEDKLDDYISNEEIKEIFDIETILINTINSNDDFNINIYMYIKEFLLYLFLSNYVNFYHKEFCLNIYKIIKESEYLNINTILSINSFKFLVHNIKNIFEALKSNKNIMKEKLKENYNKNVKNISLVYFILFIFYNRNNFCKIFNKELLLNVINSVNNDFNIDVLERGINVEHYIKFKIYFTKSKILDDIMKKEFIKNFFKNTVFNNNDFYKYNFIIKIRHIINNSDIIMKISNKKYLDDSTLIDIYNKFINYFNFN